MSPLSKSGRFAAQASFSPVDYMSGAEFGTTGNDYIHHINPAHDFTDSADGWDRAAGVLKIGGWVTAGTAGGMALGAGALIAAGASSSVALGLAGAGAAYGLGSGLHQAYLNPNAGVLEYTMAATLGGFSGGASPFGAAGNAMGSAMDYINTGKFYGTGYRLGGMIGDIGGTGALAFGRAGSLAYALKAMAPDVAGGGIGFGIGYHVTGGDVDAALGYAEWGTSIGGIASQFMIPCFPAGTLVETDQGPMRIEQLQKNDRAAARNEHDPNGPVEFKRIEEVFVRQGEILHLHISGEVIRSTPEHPFYVIDRGWTAAGELHSGDRLSTMSDEPVVVEEVFWTGEWTTVYNLRVADFRTYFITPTSRAFSAWVHNTYNQRLAHGEVRYGTAFVENSHNMTVHHYRRGKLIAQRQFVSGDLSPEEFAIARRQGLAQPWRIGDTENRALRAIEVQPGDRLFFQGQFAPCESCKNAMIAHAKRTGVEVQYRYFDKANRVRDWSAQAGGYVFAEF